MAKNDFPGWEKIRSLGEGGQGCVYLVKRADDPPDGPQYALKVLRSGEPAVAYERFAREVEAIKKVDHPSIIKIIDHSPADTTGRHYYVMDFVPHAKSLLKYLSDPGNPFRMDPARAVRIFLGILEGLEACQREKIYHRDLSPANVLIMPDEQSVKIIDFGCCHVDGHSAITLTDENIGTPNYRPPECEAGSDLRINPSTDLYSAGKILWAAITGRHAFARESPVFGNLSMRGQFPDCTRYWHVQRIFEHTIRHRPADRWSDALTARVATQRVLSLLETKSLPLELLESNCSYCRLGVLQECEARETQIRRGFGDTRQIRRTEFVCNYCGCITVMDVTQWRNTLDAIADLK